MFTSFNIPRPLDEFCANSFDARVKFLILQEEKAPGTGRLHLQGYVEFTAPQRISAAQSILGLGDIHLERRRGTQSDAIRYCSKAETRVSGPFEYGERSPGQGSRTDIHGAIEALRSSGGNVGKLILSEHAVAYVKYHNGLEKLAAYIRVPWTKPRNTYVFWGPTGTGKSRRARSMDPEAYFWSPSANGSDYAMGKLKETRSVDDTTGGPPGIYVLICF